MIEQTSFHVDSVKAQPSGPVECLGITFENETARREYFSEKLRAKLRDPEFRKIDGFPIGSDEAILALSDPPYYTACPNPFIADFIEHYGRPYDGDEAYNKEPFAADVSEGRNDPIYNAHSYHTKVPHKAIMRYILHYTKPGDIVLDGFCGTGMTGVAAQACSEPDKEFKLKIEQEWREGHLGDLQWGARHAILEDLSPAATFITYNYNKPVNIRSFERDTRRILAEVEAECAWMFETAHADGSIGRINYVIWSTVFACPECGTQMPFWSVAVDQGQGKVLDQFACPACRMSLTKAKLERVWESSFDAALQQSIRHVKQSPVLINYTAGKKRFDKVPDSRDLALIDKIAASDIPHWFPTDRMPEGDESRRNDDIGITHVHHFYTKRNLWALSAFVNKCFKCEARRTLFLLSALNVHINKMRRYQPVKPGGTPGLPGTLYISALSVELPIFDGFPRKLRDIVAAFERTPTSTNVTMTGSAHALYSVPDNAVDYIFTDPPFGANLMYSELNFLWEAWLKVYTDTRTEAVENKAQ